MAKRFKLTDDSLNCFGFRILTAGIDLSQFLKNPVMLYDHDDYQRLPIGKWENIAVEEDGMYGDAVFDMKDTFASQISQKVDDGIINMTSVGLLPLEMSSDPEHLLPGQTLPTVSKSKMREVSITPFGGNDNSLVLYDDKGKIIELNAKSLPEIFKIHQDTHQPEQNMKLINLRLKLNEDAPEEEAVTAIEALELRATQAETQLAAFRQKETEQLEAEDIALVDAAIAEQRINAAVRPTILASMKNDRENQRIILASIPRRQTAKSVVLPEEAPDKTLVRMSWKDLDRSGKLIMIKEKYPDLYKTKYKEEFGVEPK